jgi:hypothetical protein
MYEACRLIREATGNEDVQINFGLVPNEHSSDVKVTVIATGFQRAGLPEVERVSVGAANRTPARAAAPSPSFPPAPVMSSPVSRPAQVFAPSPVSPAMPVHQAEPEPIELDLDPASPDSPAADSPAATFLPLEADAIPAPEPAAPQPKSRTLDNRPEPSADDVFELDDIDTPAFLRRERKLFQ